MSSIKSLTLSTAGQVNATVNYRSLYLKYVHAINYLDLAEKFN